MTHITCRELIGFLDDYVAGDLLPARLAVFERHLSVCRSCTEYLKSYRETIRLARGAQAGIEEVPPELVTLILSAVARNTSH